MDKLRLAILISGGGTTGMALYNATKNGPLVSLVEIVGFIANKATAGGLAKAQNAGIPTRVINRVHFQDDYQFGRALNTALDELGANAIGQHGWLPKTPENVIERFKGQAINQHAGPLDPGYPDFGGASPGMYGARVSCAVLYFMRAAKILYPWTEATAHAVDPEIDRGHIIHSEKVLIEAHDTVASLQEKLLPVEHRVQIEAWRQIATGVAKPRTREEPLIDRKHVDILEQAKRIAVHLYPKG